MEAKYLAVRPGHAAIEVSITFAQRQAGASKMNLAVQLESAVLPRRLRGAHPCADLAASLAGAR